MSNKTQRQQIATAAMQALISNWNASVKICESDPRYDGANFCEVVAQNAVEFADALIKELEK